MVRRYVREHAADPGLTGTSMAHALGWSLRQIQLALQRAGTTPRDLIREERLRLVRERLQCGDCEHLTITDLAFTSGFSSASALSTAFRQRYGVSPGRCGPGVAAVAPWLRTGAAPLRSGTPASPGPSAPRSDITVVAEAAAGQKAVALRDPCGC